MNNKMYDKIAELIIASDDVGGELVKLLGAVGNKLEEGIGILITQSIPCGNEANPIVHIAVLTNKHTDFPAETQELYEQWIIDCADRIREENNRAE